MSHWKQEASPQDKSALPSISVIVMAFNEMESLEVVIQEIQSVLMALEHPYEIVVVDDGSTDGTSLVADRLARENPRVRAIHHKSNLGLGGVYRTGFAEAQCDLVTFFPADGQFPAAIIEQFVPLMGGSDMVLGYLPDRTSSLLAKSLSAAERLLYKLLFGRFPKFQGILMFRRTLLDELELKSSGRGWAVLMELIVRATRGGYRLTSVPTGMRPRMSGKSKVSNPRTVWANLRESLSLRRHL